MGNYRLDLAQWRLARLLMIIVFPIALVIYAFSGCDVRLRSEKRACRHGSAQQRGVELLVRRCDAGDTDHCRELAGALLAGNNTAASSTGTSTGVSTKRRPDQSVTSTR